VFPFTSKDIDWTMNPDITAEYKKLIAFRNSSNAIRRGELTSYSTEDVCVFTKKLGKEEVLVISNLRNKPIEFALPSAIKNSTWKDAMKGGKVTLPTSISLQPYSYYVFKK
jgi:glycosidase